MSNPSTATEAAVAAVWSTRGVVSRRLIAADRLRRGYDAAEIAEAVTITRSCDGAAEAAELDALTATLTAAIEDEGRHAVARALEAAHMKDRDFNNETDQFELHGYAAHTKGFFTGRVAPVTLKRGTMAECYREWRSLLNSVEFAAGQFDIIPAGYFPSELKLQASRDYQTR